MTRRVGTICPSCSPDIPTAHEVLSEGGQWTVRCTECGHVHKTTVDDRTVERDVVVSQDGDSFTTTVEIPPKEPLEVGDEFVAESNEGVFVVRVTSLEVGNEERTETAPAKAIETVWTRDVGNVAVSVTVHPVDGYREGTQSFKAHVPGDHEFVVGETAELGEDTVEIEGIFVRDDAPTYRFDKLDHDGDTVRAKDIKRLYARATGRSRRTAWSGW
jgi:uncharacterized Zn finger protein